MYEILEEYLGYKLFFSHFLLNNTVELKQTANKRISEMQ